MDIGFLAVCFVTLMLVRAGQMLFDTGMSRSKNAASVVMRALCDLATCSLCFWGIGAAILLQGQNRFLGMSPGLLFSDQPLVAIYLPLVLIASGQVMGAIGERARFVVVAPLSALMGVLVVPLIGHWTWRGFVAQGSLDLGGAMPLHLASATVAIVAAAMVGARSGKYNHDGSVNGIPAHNITLMGGGMMLMLAGWLGYLLIPASMVNLSFTHTVVNGLLAACAGAAGAMTYSGVRYRKPDLMLTMLGMIAGMVSVTAGVGLLPTWGAVVLGAVAGVAGPMLTIWLDVRWRIDDASGLASSVGAGALVAVVGSPLLTLRWFGPMAGALGYNLLGAILTVVVAGGLTWLLMQLLKRVTKIRVSEADEYDGLDLVEHDINAYPDFQQTMIKSYHLRQA